MTGQTPKERVRDRYRAEAVAHGVPAEQVDAYAETMLGTANAAFEVLGEALRDVRAVLPRPLRQLLGDASTPTPTTEAKEAER